jgi:hypothetical protein
MTPPNGYPEIIADFGNPSDPANPLKANPDWVSANIIRVSPPAGWQLYYQEDHKPLVKISGIHMHKLLADSFNTVMTEIWAYAKQAIGVGATNEAVQQWLHDRRLDQTGGGYNFRPNTSNPAVLSLHSFGIAIDWDPDHNPRGSTASTLPDWWYTIWLNNGWSNGKHFHTPDPMHVQFATGA